MENIKLYLNRDPADQSHTWSEFAIQAYIVMQTRRMGLIVHGDQNGASKTRKGINQAKASGALAGWPDLCFILPDGPFWIELKRGKEKRSVEQIGVHADMIAAGCRVNTVNALSPEDGFRKVIEALGIGKEFFK